MNEKQQEFFNAIKERYQVFGCTPILMMEYEFWWSTNFALDMGVIDTGVPDRDINRAMSTWVD